MFTPFDYWASVWRSGSAMMETATRMSETLVASQAVIDSRTRTMADAARDPFRADYSELSRMVPEKLSAFSRAGASALDDMQAAQRHAIDSWQTVIGAAFAGRMLTGREMSRLGSRSTAMVERSAKAAGKALAPIHSGATGNARRLGKAKPAR